MQGYNEAMVLLAKCTLTHKTYGMRTENANGQWLRTWAFPIAEESAKHENYDQSTISGNIVDSPDYPGCPYCGSKDVTVCSRCHHLSCLQAERNTAACEWCGTSGIVAAYSGQAISASNDV